MLSSRANAAGEWKLTHKYGTGLEVDLERERLDSQASRVQLPEAPLRGMRQLNEALRMPRAVTFYDDCGTSRSGAAPGPAGRSRR